MQHIGKLMFFSLFAFGMVSAQNSGDCRTAIPVCADQPYMGIANGGGDIDDFDPEVVVQTGCLEKGSGSSANIEHNTSWYVFRAGTDGQVGFDIEALPPAVVLLPRNGISPFTVRLMKPVANPFAPV